MLVRKLTAWSDAAELALAPTLEEDREAIIRGVNEGRLELFELNAGDAHMVTCVDRDLNELIVCCIAGEGLRDVSSVLWRTAQHQQLSAVRWFAKSPALARLIAGKPERYPVRLLGHVYRCEVTPRVTQ